MKRLGGILRSRSEKSTLVIKTHLPSNFDLLNNNNSIIRNVTDYYIEDLQTQVLNRYFMLTLTYNLRKFGEKK